MIDDFTQANGEPGAKDETLGKREPAEEEPRKDGKPYTPNMVGYDSFRGTTDFDHLGTYDDQESSRFPW